MIDQKLIHNKFKVNFYNELNYRFSSIVFVRIACKNTDHPVISKKNKYLKIFKFQSD